MDKTKKIVEVIKVLMKKKYTGYIKITSSAWPGDKFNRFLILLSL